MEKKSLAPTIASLRFADQAGFTRQSSGLINTGRSPMLIRKTAII
jgi:hypothetical protein